MEENKKFRNHFSIVFERLGAGFVAFAMIFLYEGAELLGDIGTFLKDIDNLKEELFVILVIIAAIFTLFAIVLGIQIFRWSKTYISIQEQAIVIEVNTLKRKKNTIGIKNISNINLEQNLFEMLMGTYKVKMDTNSMSTADATDVKIVLKKKQAQEFRAQILGMIAKTEHRYADNKDTVNRKYPENAEIEIYIEEQGSAKGAGFEQMLIQGIFSMKLISIPLVILSIGGVVFTITEALEAGKTAEGILGVLSSVFVIGLFGVSMFWDIVKGFIQYYGFRIYRLGDRLHIRYGILKKVSYTIPVDKINAVKLVQSPQARMTGRYMAELVNVGMGDDENEAQSFFLLYDKKEKINERIKMLLPEFADELETEVCMQSAKVWIVWLVSATIYLLVMSAILGVVNEFANEIMLIAVAVAATITVFVMLYVVGNYFTRGYYVGEKTLKLADGNFGKTILLVKYNKIQYVETKQNFLAKKFGMQKGEIYLLASTRNRMHNIPYFQERQLEKIRESLLQ